MENKLKLNVTSSASTHLNINSSVKNYSPNMFVSTGAIIPANFAIKTHNTPTKTNNNNCTVNTLPSH